MDRTYWHRQTKDKPLFQDLLWSRPENRAHAGKLLIVGGNAMGFSAPAEAYSQSLQAGVGTTRVLLPLSVKKELPPAFNEAEFAANTPSGSFAGAALGELLAATEWADGVLLAGDFGRNSETAILLENFAQKYTDLVTITQDAVDYFTPTPLPLLSRQQTLLVISFAQLQKLAINAKSTQAFTFGMDFLHLVDGLHDFTSLHKAAIITKHLDTIFVAVNGQVSTTKLEKDMPIWRVKTAAHATTWWLQNPTKPFEAQTVAVSQTEPNG